MAERELHITFTESGAHSLRKVLARLGMDATVISPFDDLGLGPIQNVSARDRIAWIENELRYADPDPDEWANKIEAFWNAVAKADEASVVWISGRVVGEAAGLMRLIAELDGWCPDVIDMTEMRSRGGQGLPTLALLTEETLEVARPWENRRTLTSDERDRSVSTWRRLVSEDAPVRVLIDGELTSAPITFFDDRLLSHATGEWRKMAYLVGYSLADDGDTDVYQVGDLLLSARARVLAEQGRLEWRGDLSDIRACEVRLPS